MRSATGYEERSIRFPPLKRRRSSTATDLSGVVRVYESADTPHVAISSGAVFVREVAGKSDASDPRKPGGGTRGERAYEAARIRSRAQLVELADRGRRGAARVEAVLDPLRPLPLIADGLELRSSSLVRTSSSRDSPTTPPSSSGSRRTRCPGGGGQLPPRPRLPCWRLPRTSPIAWAVPELGCPRPRWREFPDGSDQ